MKSTIPQQPTKAGVFLWGAACDKTGKTLTHMLTSYAEGAYGERNKHYYIPKGSLDDGESSLQAAVRETYEETGVDIEKLLGKEAFTRFLKGEVIHNLASDGYAGVTVECADPTPMPAPYRAGNGTMHKVHYFSIKVDGIEKLLPHLKQFDSRESPDLAQVKTSARVHAENAQLPTFLQMLEMLRSGVVPANQAGIWSGEEAKTIIESPAFPALEHKYCGEAHLSKLADWIAFHKGVPPQERTALKKDFDKIKAHLEGLDLVGDAGNKLKLDTTDWPLVFYQESAEILPIDGLLQRSSVLANKNNEYDLNMWGAHDAAQSEASRMNAAQIAALVRFFTEVSPMEVALAGVSSSPTMAMKLGRTDKALNQHIQSAVDYSMPQGWQGRTQEKLATRSSAAER